MVSIRRVDAPLFSFRTDDVLGITYFMFHRRYFKFGGRRDNTSEPFYQPDVRAPDLPLPLVVGGLLLRSISFGTKSQMLVRRRVGEPARSIAFTSTK